MADFSIEWLVFSVISVTNVVVGANLGIGFGKSAVQEMICERESFDGGNLNTRAAGTAMRLFPRTLRRSLDVERLKSVASRCTYCNAIRITNIVNHASV